MQIRAFHDASTGTFSYLLDDGAGRCAVIDPVMGFDAASGRRDAAPVEVLAQTITREGLALDWILETHAHADHLSGGPWLRERLGGRLAIGENIRAVQKTFGAVFNAADLVADGSQFDHLFAEGERFNVGQLGLDVLHVPGHTPADVAYRVTDPAGQSDAVFVGDTLFMPSAGTARCDFPGGDAHQLYRSVHRLLALAPGTRLFVCHDYPAEGDVPQHVATVAAQRAHNIHVGDGIAQADFVERRHARDAGLAMPRLMMPSVQVNIRAGRLPPPDANGTSYLRIPVDRF